MAVRGESGWQATHQKAFGKERWPQLLKSLRQPVSHVALVNSFLPPARQEEVCRVRSLQPHGVIPMVFVGADGTCAAEGVTADDPDGDGLVEPPTVAFSDTGTASMAAGYSAAPQTTLHELLPCYFLDGASAVAALMVDAQPGCSVLDLCAAPGGKSLMLASIMFGSGTSSGKLVCNEMSRPRCQRLQRVLSSFLPPDFLSPGAGGRVTVTNTDATPSSGGTPPQLLQRLAPFDRVLVDSPCTSDRHLVHQGATGLSHWAIGAVKANAERQLELLRTASALVKPGGLVVYCTCALAEQENDGVVAKFLKKAGKNFSLEPLAENSSPLLQGADFTSNGALILPDTTPYGPMYIARLRRS
eukprot:TRINITY_DN77295_c0_g1_i1.p1 TRINITY_DN77295_c0_g1~~TRINITY_DN77295_c0_g1_i1.p1  ORF type:complete len:358 (-),score=57.38 TRINITY_DN77295_c0_g1_i1:164-1237(-)